MNRKVDIYLSKATQWREEFTELRKIALASGLTEVRTLKKVLKAYIAEAIATEEAGLKVEFKKPADLVIPKDIQAKLKKIPGLATAFKDLTPGRKRAYVLHFSSAKQEKTKEARIAKSAQKIFEGKGPNEY